MDYASKTSPMRASAATGLLQCAMGRIMEQMHPSSGGEAAQNGSAVGRIIEVWHKTMDSRVGSRSPEDAIEAAIIQVRGEREKQFPLADMEQMERVARLYAADSRNRGGYGRVLSESMEAKVELVIESEWTEPVYIVGHLDQLRDHGDAVRLWDTKFSKKHYGATLPLYYSFQQALYTIGAADLIGKPVQPGGIIALQAYLQQAADAMSKVFIHNQVTLEQCYILAAEVVRQVARIRRGEIDVRPGEHCRWCQGVSPANCIKVRATLK
jgi:hypothetical protein